jgi:2-dehydro-3-deoxyglucarate aldolase/4-hydroxy-2-oxoheptanedioate aldolase
MKRSNLRQRLEHGETVIGTMVQEVRTPAIAQILKQVGFDFLMLDMEHGAFNLETAAEIIRVARLTEIPPLVRVAGPQYELIGRILDQGAVGVMLPRVERRGEVELLVQSIKYPPLGKRGMSSDAPHSGYNFKSLAEFVELNNEDTIAIAQIERKAAIENIDDILAVPGVDVALVGPEDLSVSLGLAEGDVQALVTRAIETMMAAARRHGVVSAIHMGSRTAAGLAAQGHGHGHVFVRPRLSFGGPEQGRARAPPHRQIAKSPRPARLSPVPMGWRCDGKRLNVRIPMRFQR